MDFQTIVLIALGALAYWGMHRKAEAYREDLNRANDEIIELRQELSELRRNTDATRS